MIIGYGSQLSIGVLTPRLIPAVIGGMLQGGTISLYLVDVHPDWRGGAKFKPIVISCNNYISSVSRSMKGKRIIAYFPKIHVSYMQIYY